MARVSVVLTVYNGERYVEEALASLRAQTYPDFETIVVDDGSTDRTVEIVRGHAGDRVRLLCPGRLGRGRALNYGVAHSDGEYIAVLDADDIALPTRLERQVELLDACPEVGLLGTGFRRLYNDGRAEDFPSAETDAELRHALLLDTLFHHSTAMYRRECFGRAGGYDESLACCLDHDFFLRMARHVRLGGIRDILCVRRVTGGNYFMTMFGRWDRVRALARSRFRHLRHLCPAPAWWFYWMVTLVVPTRIRRWLRRRPSPRQAPGSDPIPS